MAEELKYPNLTVCFSNYFEKDLMKSKLLLEVYYSLSHDD